MLMTNDVSAGHLINRAARLYRQLADQRLAPLGLSSGHLPVLTALMARPEMSQKDLVEHAGIEQPTMAATLNRMERDAIIERRPDPTDGRSSLFSLTVHTRAKATLITAVVAGMSSDTFAELDGEEASRLRSSLKTVIGTVERLLSA